jgi:hypothetical protein
LSQRIKRKDNRPIEELKVKRIRMFPEQRGTQ